MDGAKKTVTDRLRQLRKVHVEEFCAPLVDALAQIRIVLVGRAELDGVGQRKRAVQRMSSGSAGHDADAERLAGGVQFLGAGGDGLGNVLGGAGGSEAAEGDGLPVLDEFGGFGRGGGAGMISMVIN